MAPRRANGLPSRWDRDQTGSCRADDVLVGLPGYGAPLMWHGERVRVVVMVRL